MARAAPYVAGEIVRFRSYGRGDYLLATAPSGIEVKIPAPTGSTGLWLAEPGRWTIQWGSSEPEQIEVLAAPAPEHEEIPPPPKPTAPLTSSA